MAGDWIKMRIDLQSHPKVVRILSATRADKFKTVGGLHAVWSVFDTHSEDGILHGYTPETLDHVIGWDGFAQAMIDVGWLRYDGAQTLAMPEFAEHNGQSARRRAEDQKRKRETRKTRPQSVRNLSAENADTKRTREEKRREVNPIVGLPENDTQKFTLFWKAWPASQRKVAKAECQKKWRSMKLDPLAEQIITHVEAMKLKKQWRDGYEPAPLTYLNQRRWEDGADDAAVHSHADIFAGVE